MEYEYISKKDLQDKFNHHLTIGDLKKFLSDTKLLDDSKVLIQRVEDVYYEKHNWKVYLNNSDKYTPAWACFESDKHDCLFIDMHY